MYIAIHQPDYLPYIGYFYKIAQVDTFVFLDDCQFSNDNMHHWNRIKTPQGECRLKIPIACKFGDAINEAQSKDELKWKDKHLKTIEMNYKKAKYFNDFFPAFKELLNAKYNNLADMNVTLNTWICDCFGLKPKFIRTSQMNIKTVREEKVIDICIACNEKIYISGNGAKAYQVEQHFTDRGVQLKYTDYHPFEYPQLWKSFIPNMSIIDYICNCGFDWEFADRKLRKY